jgi:hypothetical protein
MYEMCSQAASQKTRIVLTKSEALAATIPE